jgi:hypothetical protein
MQCYELPVSTNPEATQMLSQCELIMLTIWMCASRSHLTVKFAFARVVLIGASGTRVAVIPRGRHCIRRSKFHTDIKAHVWSKSLQTLL